MLLRCFWCTSTWKAKCLSVFQWSCYSVLLQLSVVIQHTQLSHTAVCSLLRVTHTHYWKTSIYISWHELKNTGLWYSFPFLNIWSVWIVPRWTSHPLVKKNRRVVLASFLLLITGVGETFIPFVMFFDHKYYRSQGKVFGNHSFCLTCKVLLMFILLSTLILSTDGEFRCDCQLISKRIIFSLSLSSRSLCLLPISFDLYRHCHTVKPSRR